MTRIGESAFFYCGSLQSIEIPDSVTGIGEDAFGGCSSLRSIEIPSSVTSIGYGAFQNCKSLSSLTLHYKEPLDLSLGLVAELPISGKITLHVPVGTGEAYRHHPEFSKVKEVIDDVR